MPNAVEYTKICWKTRRCVSSFSFPDFVFLFICSVSREFAIWFSVVVLLLGWLWRRTRN